MTASHEDVVPQDRAESAPRHPRWRAHALLGAVVFLLLLIAAYFATGSRRRSRRRCSPRLRNPGQLRRGERYRQTSSFQGIKKLDADEGSKDLNAD
jgi:hypothetical protein